MKNKNSFFKKTTVLLCSTFILASCTPEATETFTVTWQDSDGTTLEVDEDVLADTLPTYDGDNPTKNGDAQYTYTFSGWSPEVTNVAEDITYVAQYTSTINTYTVTWKNSDETVLEIDDDVPYGTMPSYDGETPFCLGTDQFYYDFSGWDQELSIVTGDITYTACFLPTINTFTITWKDYDGAVLEVDENVIYGNTPTYDGTSLTREATAQYTYTFSGWSPVVVSVTADATYTANYDTTLNTFRITWKNYDGTVLETDEAVPYGATPTYDGAAPTKELYGSHTYSFSGWSPVVEPANGETIYVAQYTANAKNPHEYLYYSEGENSVTITGFIYSGYVSLILPELINDKPVTSIGDMAFYNCTSLKYVDIPDSVTYIGNNAFSFCTRLETVELSQNVATIGSQAFSTCLSLASIDIPDSVNSLGIQAFGDCSNLSSAKLPNNLPAINIGTFLRCQKLETIEIPNSVTTIANNAFSDCLKLESIDIPSSVEYIGTEAFVRCTELKEVYIPISVTYIGDYAFKNINSTPQVYCEAVSKPEGWSADWIIDSSCVIWDCLNN